MPRRLLPTLIVIAVIALTITMLSGIVPAVEDVLRLILPQFPGTKLIPLGEPSRPTPSPTLPASVVTHEVAPNIRPTHTPTHTTIPPKPTAIEIQRPAVITYTVEPGDTVARLANHYGSTVAAIAEASGLDDPGRIAVGQVLTIPILSSPSEAPREAE